MVFGGNTSVKGEVYEVSQSALRDLDRLESYDSKHPERGLYNRQLILIQLKDGDVAALAYFLDEIPRTVRGAGHPVIPSGDWREALKWDYVEDEPFNNKK